MNLLSDRQRLIRPIALFILVALLISVPVMVKSPYLMTVLIASCFAVILGMSFSMIYSTGLITLGTAAFYAIGAYASALLIMKLNLSFWVASPLAIIITGIIAFAIGLVIIRVGTFIFVVLTLLFNVFIVQICGQFPVLGGWRGFVNIPRPEPISIPWPAPIEFVSHAAYYYLVLFALLLVVFISHIIYTSRIGRAWQMIKQSERLAESLGMSVYRYRVLAFVIASSLAGLAGSLDAHYLGVVYPDMFGVFTSVYIQVYAALGGLGFPILGPVIGAPIMVIGPYLLSDIPEIQPIIFGVVLIAIIVFFPSGIAGSLQMLRRGYFARGKAYEKVDV
jgi:branched-chain amino acid transport system permease protein